MNQLFASAGLILLFASSTYCKGTSADLILHSGKIVTVDKHFTICQVLAVKDGRLLKVGSNKEALASRGPETEVVDLAGRVVLPGLIDSHVHPIGASEIELDHEIPSMESIGDVLEYIRGRAKVVSAGEWIVLRQAFITRLREQRFPTRAELDEAAPRNPVAFITGPDAAANSLAFEKSGIDPAGDYVWLLKDPQTGQASGIVRRRCPS